jgi:hypothetical protein
VSHARNLSRTWFDVRSLMHITKFGLIDEVQVCGGFGVSCRFAENCLDRGLGQSPISVSNLILQEAGISCSRTLIIISNLVDCKLSTGGIDVRL